MTEHKEVFIMYDAIVIGGGQAGLAAAYWLHSAGVRYTVLNASPEPAGSWPLHYESLKLFSPAEYSSLPGTPFPAPKGHYPTRDEVVDYLKTYADTHNLCIQNNTRVENIQRGGDGLFQVETQGGESYRARAIITASGSFNCPYLPVLEGQGRFEGRLLHSMQYDNPEAFRGQRVVVVGAANTAVQIAFELSGVADTALAVRDRVRWTPQNILGKDIHFWLQKTGLDHASFLSDQSTPVLDTGKYREALRSGQIKQWPMFTSFTERGVQWEDGSFEGVDAVIFATGFRPNVPYLKGLGVGDPKESKARGGISRTVPGLYYVGFSGQRSMSSATLRGVGRDAAHVVRHLEAYLSASLQRAQPRCCGFVSCCS